jgi:hypothetical protein
MSKIDAAELAEVTRQQLEPSNKRGGNGHGKDAMNTTTRKEENPNSSESVEASLEDFISQANASFPTSDGWDLHTGDVELVDDVDADEGRLEQMEHVSAPIVVKPAHRKAETAAHLIKKADQSARVRKISAAMLDDPNGATMVTQAPKRRANPFEAPASLGIDDEPAPLDPPPTGPRRRAERTEVVSSPLRTSVPWTANPLVWIAGVFAAFVMGAVLVFVMVRTMMPSQPVVVQAPAPVVLPAPAAAAAPAAATGGPVVTPLGKSTADSRQPTGQPVVTPLEEAKAAPAEAPAAVDVEKAKPARHVAAKRAAKATVAAKEPVAKAAPAEMPAKAEAPAKAAPKKAAAAASASDDDDDDSAPAAPAPKHKAAPAAKKDAKPAKGGDWVDPFSQ